MITSNTLIKYMEVKPGVCRHCKGEYYLVIGVAKHSETLEDLVVYMILYDHSEFGSHALWVRPKKTILETVEVDGKKVPMFQYVGPNE